MKTEKLSLKAIKNVLSRAEMRKIMAGSSVDCNRGLCGNDGSNTSCPSGCGCQAMNGDPANGYLCV
ncbi:MAG TPA: hypothetical protein VIM16_10320 [Mucilaginibacter sp.]|jgi:hypothetical protein